MPKILMPKIAISYRRSDSSAITGRIFDRLVAHYGKESVFMDVDNIPIGTDFRSHIRAVLLETEVLIVVIGPRWLGTDSAGAVRMSQESDPVRAEVEAALAQELPMIPLLVDGAKMPDSTALPASIQKFAFLNAAEVATGRDFHPHMDRLIAAIDATLGARASAGAATPYAAAPRTVAGHAHSAAPQSWPADLAVYLVVPIVILLVAHYVIAYALDIDYGYLWFVSIALSSAFGFLLFWLTGRGAVAAVAIAVTLGVVAVSGMTVSDGLNSGQPILPETRVEWRDNIVFAVSIALGFIAGHALIPVGMALRRKIGKI
jgi:TIR domain-containing protein